jgi:hypothetical protein
MLQGYALHSPKLGGRALALRALVGLTGPNPEQRTTWMHCAMVGEWRGHSEGPFTLTLEDFKSVVAEFESKQNPTKIDYEHGSLVDDGQPKPSAGFVQKYKIEGDNLYALVEFTKRAAQMIRDGEYRFCSPVFVWDRPDRKSGEALPCFIHSIALTDTPFLDGQRPLALSQSGVSLTQLTQRRRALSVGGKMEIPRDALEEALKSIEGDKFTEAQIASLVKSVIERMKAEDPDAGADIEVEVEEPAEMADAAPLKSDDKAKDKPKAEGDDKSKALADAPIPPPVEEVPAADAVPADPASIVAELESIAAAMGKDVAGVLAYLREMATAGVGEAAAANPAALKAEVAALSATVRSYGAQLSTYRKRDEAEAKAKREAEQRALSAEVDEMVTRGVIVKADAEKWRELALSHPKNFRELSSTLKPVVPTGREASALEAPPAPESRPTDGPPLDKSDPQVRALFDRYRKNWRVNDEPTLERLVRRHIATNQVSAG